MSQPQAHFQSILLIRLPGLLAQCRLPRSQVRFQCYPDCTNECCTQLMLECPGNLRLNTWTKTDTCRDASSDLAKRPVQAPSQFLAEVVRDQGRLDNLLQLRGGR